MCFVFWPFFSYRAAVTMFPVTFLQVYVRLNCWLFFTSHQTKSQIRNPFTTLYAFRTRKIDWFVLNYCMNCCKNKSFFFHSFSIRHMRMRKPIELYLIYEFCQRFSVAQKTTDKGKEIKMRKINNFRLRSKFNHWIQTTAGNWSLKIWEVIKPLLVLSKINSFFIRYPSEICYRTYAHDPNSTAKQIFIQYYL